MTIVQTFGDELGAAWKAASTEIGEARTCAEHWAGVQHSIVDPLLRKAASFLRVALSGSCTTTVEPYVDGIRLNVEALSAVHYLDFELNAADRRVIYSSSLADEDESFKPEELTDAAVRALLLPFVKSIGRISAKR